MRALTGTRAVTFLGNAEDEFVTRARTDAAAVAVLINLIISVRHMAADYARPLINDPPRPRTRYTACTHAMYPCSSDFLALQASIIDRTEGVEAGNLDENVYLSVRYKRLLLQAIVIHDRCRDTPSSSLNYVR